MRSILAALFAVALLSIGGAMANTITITNPADGESRISGQAFDLTGIQQIDDADTASHFLFSEFYRTSTSSWVSIPTNPATVQTVYCLGQGVPWDPYASTFNFPDVIIKTANVDPGDTVMVRVFANKTGPGGRIATSPGISVVVARVKEGEISVDPLESEAEAPSLSGHTISPSRTQTGEAGSRDPDAEVPSRNTTAELPLRSGDADIPNRTNTGGLES